MRVALTIAFLILLPQLLIAQEECFIYGVITTVDDKKYEGPIRWDDEEVFWSDYFNSIKAQNKYHKYVEEEDIMTNIQSWFSWDDGGKREHDHKKAKVVHEVKELKHVWVCHFGDIKSLQIDGKEVVRITLKNNDVVKVMGGANDIDTDIKILDEDFGELIINWDRIKLVNFQRTPSKLSKTFGKPLYGTVKTTSGKFTGYVHWDNDERLTTDKLDGDTEDGEVSLPFENIESITKNGENKSDIKLKSGRTLTLSGSNDVNHENRGIIICQKDLGNVDVKWDEFESIEFTEAKNEKLSEYNDFKRPEKIKGSVITKNGDTYKGRLAYDLDEEYDFELIQGKNNDIEYSIPLTNIKSLSPYKGDKTEIKLKNGKTIILGGTHDVSEHNSGVLIFTNENDPVHVKWDQVSKVELHP